MSAQPLSVATPAGYSAGTWAIDATHSEVSFSVKHLGIAKVRGRFDSFEGRVVTGENPLDSSVTATIHTDSVSTGNAQRDEHVRAEDFLHAAVFPSMTFRSIAIRAADEGAGFLVEGELTLRGVTRPVSLALELGSFGTGFEGKPAVGFSASTEIRRSQFGVSAGPAGAMVGDVIKISLEMEANRL